jgi:kynurenine formamidase
MGKTKKADWPVSPTIMEAEIRAYEKKEGELKPGEIVLFRSMWTDKYYRTGPGGGVHGRTVDRQEGWPALHVGAIVYLASKGVRFVGTDAPTLGGVNAKQAL